MPREHKRVKRLVLNLDVPSGHELLLLKLDRLSAEQGGTLLTRYSPPRPRNG